MLGGRIRFVGTPAYTCSGADPLLTDWTSERASGTAPTCLDAEVPGRASRAAELDRCGMFFWNFVTIDTLNLAVELRGSTEAFLDVNASPRELGELMRFGVDYAHWFHRLEQEIIGPHNLAVADGHRFAVEAPYIGLPWSSVDAYLLCDARVYRDLGLSYHAEFFQRCGGGPCIPTGLVCLSCCR